MRRVGVVNLYQAGWHRKRIFRLLSQQNKLTGTGVLLFYGLCPETDKQRRITMTTQKIPYKIYLEESEMPKQYYNLRADMQQKPAPLLNPRTKEPMTAEEQTPA